MLEPSVASHAEAPFAPRAAREVAGFELDFDVAVVGLGEPPRGEPSREASEARSPSASDPRARGPGRAGAQSGRA